MEDEYGTCCICSEDIIGISYIVELYFKAPAECQSSWGCFKCGLPNEGAIAIICEKCADTDDVYEDIRFIMDGFEDRLPVPPKCERVHHDHDYARHPEMININEPDLN